MGQKPYVLVAYEDPFTLFLMGELFVALGFGPGTVKTTCSGHEAVGFAVKHGKPLFSMIGRQFKGEMTGDELLNQLLKKNPDLRYFRIASDPDLVTDDLHPIELRGLGVWDLVAGFLSLKKLLAQHGLLPS